MEVIVILCPHEKIISKSEADFDTQWRRQMPRDLEGWRRYDFIIVGGGVMPKAQCSLE